MKKIAWHITSNGQKGDDHKEYDRTKYHCEKDDAWVETELPITK